MVVVVVLEKEGWRVENAKMTRCAKTYDAAL